MVFIYTHTYIGGFVWFNGLWQTLFSGILTMYVSNFELFSCLFLCIALFCSVFLN